MIEVARLDDLNAAELFLGFRIGSVGRRDFAVFPVQSHRGLRRLKSYFRDKMPVGAQVVIVLKAFVEGCVSLVLGHPFEFSRLDISQTDVFHCSSPCALNRSSYSRRAQQKSTAESNFYCPTEKKVIVPKSQSFPKQSA